MSEEKAVSRRQFLKIAGVAGASIGVAGGLGGLVAACGSNGTTTTTGPATPAGATTTTAGAATTTTAAAETTTVSAAAEAGREIKVGVVVPKTGPLAAFAGPFDWVNSQWKKALTDGVVAGDGKKHAINILTQDTQSDTNRCAQVTGDLIQNDKVDIVFAGGAPDTMNPAGDVCESMGTPGLMIQGPWQAFYMGRQKDPKNPVPFKWTYALTVGIEAMSTVFADMWNSLSTNKKVGLIYSNSTDGQSWADEKTGGPFYFKQAGYTYTMPGLYQPGSEDYTQQISQFKKFGAEVCAGAMTSGDFTNFWKQAIQQGFHPKLCTVGQALNFAETANAIGPTVVGLTTEISWHPDYPYKDSLGNRTCKEFAAAYETDTGKQWSAELIMHSLMEWFVAGVKGCSNLDDKAGLMAAVVAAKVETIYGPVDFSIAVDPAAQADVTHPVPNCLHMPTAAGQWLKGTKWPYEKFLVDNKFVSGATVTNKVQEITYS